MDRQEIFDTVLDHLRKQGCQAMDEVQEQCMYRGPNSTKCAAGFLISDDDYDPQMEGMNFRALIGLGNIEFIDPNDPNLDTITKKRLVIKDKFFKNSDLIVQMQHAHDQFKSESLPSEPFVDYINRRFKLIAQDCGVVYKD